MSEDEIPESEPTSMPGWVMTFADLMSLLMCFFVLLLSFSEMDLQKFKQVAGAMEKAFGVQRAVKVSSPPRGTSIIAQEFSPGKPEPTPMNEVRQFTTEDMEDFLKIEQESLNSVASASSYMAKELVEDINKGLLEIETDQAHIIIRILENGSFESASADLREDFLPTLKKIGDIIKITPGKIEVSGYTDSLPIENALYRSNWELSAIRAFSVIDALQKYNEIESERFKLIGHGENYPIAENDTAENRSKNRRVEILIAQGEEPMIDEDEVIKIEDESDVELIPVSKQVNEKIMEDTFPPLLEITSDSAESEEDDLGLFEEDVLYNYELDDQIITKPEEKSLDSLP